MVQHWSPIKQVERSAEKNVWYMFDRGSRIAIIMLIEVGVKKEPMYRAVTFAAKSEDRILLGYFPHLPMAAEIVWREYQEGMKRIREHN
jgi:hypothetical protein